MLQPNTLAAYALAAQKGADMIEMDARMTADGVLIANHDPDVKGYDQNGNAVSYRISETPYSVIQTLCLTQDGAAENRIPTLADVLELAYFSGLCVNIDLKEKLLHAAETAQLVVGTGMRGRVVYATNGAGAAAIHTILEKDPQARFIDTKQNYTAQALQTVPAYPAKCFVYTADFSDENIQEIRESGCMLAVTSLHEGNAQAGLRHHPDMAEYLHTSDFAAIEATLHKSGGV